MKVRLLKQYGVLSPGAIIEPNPKDVGRLLIARGIAEPCEENNQNKRGGKNDTNKAFQKPPKR